MTLKVRSGHLISVRFFQASASSPYICNTGELCEQIFILQAGTSGPLHLLSDMQNRLISLLCGIFPNPFIILQMLP